MDVCILIPCYNESAAVGNLVKSVLAHVRDVVVVDDGSSDGTDKAAESAGAYVIRHNINRGKGCALRSGFEYIIKRGIWDAVIVMDGDGQHDPAEIGKFIKEAQDTGAGIVAGDRMGRGRPPNMPLIRWITNKFTSFVVSAVARRKIADSQCGYRLIRVGLLKNITLNTSRYDIESEILIMAAGRGEKIVSVPVNSVYGGQVSSINPLRDTIRFFKLIYMSVFYRGRRMGKV